jgi:hypothetical protein
VTDRPISDRLQHRIIVPILMCIHATKGAYMVRRRQRERSLFEVLLPDGHKVWPDLTGLRRKLDGSAAGA